ncbi:MAG: hypothetical protein V3W41_04670 [Planctomycetota bacterium]
MTAKQQHTIVVKGHMNPRIHHPLWYQVTGILAEDQVQTSLVANAKLLMMPQLTQFATPGLHVQCMPDQWLATSSPNTGSESVLALACGTFERLADTPVTAFGLNVTTATDVDPARLAAITEDFARLPFQAPISGTQPEPEQVVFSYKLPPLKLAEDEHVSRRFRVTVTVKSDPSPALSVAINVHHDIHVTTRRNFDLARMLTAAAPVFQLAENQTSQVLGDRIAD